jgi:hypothetical protein
MEPFHDVILGFDKAKHSIAFVRGPISQIKIKEGETKIVALKKPGPGDNFDPADITVAHPWIAWSWVVRKLRDKKHTYEDNKWTFQMIMEQGVTDPLEQRSFLFFQVVGLGEGQTQLERFPNA